MLEQRRRFGPELRRLRTEAEMSLTRLSARVHYSKSQLSKVERGLKPPTPELARLCDTALGADGTLAALVPPPVTAQPLDDIPGTTDEGEVWLMRLSADGPSSFQSIGRRHLVAAGAASVVSLGLGSPTAYADGTRLIDSSRSLFDHLRHLGQSTDPGLLLPTLIAQTHSVRDLARDAGAHTRGELLKLASRYAEYIGWLVQETGDERGALWWTDRAVELAEAGGDRDLAAYALVRRALVTFYRDDHVRTVELARQAQAAQPPPRIAGLAAQQEAQGHALAGDRDACTAALDRARELLERAADEPDAPLIGSALNDPVSMITGWCLHDLGQPQRAAELLDREVERIPAHAVRNQARYGLRRALAHAQAGEVDHACGLTERLLDKVNTVGSATVRADLRRLLRTLSRHPAHPQVRELQHRLANSLHTVPS
ncbi:helix-turn-helix domain-containing protein [Streptomyces sp. NBC_01795]|uniref:helix-turn-helix transcriptional regulator n=1 Tax=unclassified Streptomyces TaxID=2593676 RepID=UPI002DDAAA48|nr:MULTISPECIES: helix-turn-helix transcriptional regulator [unclassified Streptomyces]WSA96350.1 helix-turn-helix domain-containing protein [Streptomyces sp. NBC_01795]WSB80764.1 helix-turn-helix domain-containing protein [Streptomyces sp. NBC_01775]WSS11027.1 helix-turn-helix domain-containing protein [Streptomyces sp. NBC_01186]